MKRLLHARLAQRLSVQMIGLYLSFALRSSRWRIEADPATWRLLTGQAGQTGQTGQTGQGAIVVFWHEYLPAVPVLWWRARRQQPDLALHALISRHRDGQMIGGVMRRWNIGIVEGSSAKAGKAEKGGAAAMRNLLRLLRRGDVVALTPDGPRGPKRVMQPGTAHLAAASGIAVVPIAARLRPALRLRSWDRMLLPLPFSSGTILCGQPIAIARSQEAEGLLRVADALQALDRAAARS